MTKEKKNKEVLDKNTKELEIAINRLENTKAIVGLKLITEAKFMESVLYDLKEKIKEEGIVSKFEQGSQKFDRESQALKSYNTTIKNYQAIIKQINEMLPKEEVVNEEDFPL